MSARRRSGEPSWATGPRTAPVLEETRLPERSSRITGRSVPFSDAGPEMESTSTHADGSESPPAASSRSVGTLGAGLWLAWTGLAGLLGAQAYVSLGWRMEHDTPLLHYAAFLMEVHDRVPYRDIFETSMPGVFAFHSLVSRLAGYGDSAFRLVDLTVLGLLLALIYAFASRFGRLAGAWGAVVFGLVYLSKGPAMSLQRDHLGVFPVALALLCVPAEASRMGSRRFAVAGLLFGAAALVKPHAAIGLPVVIATLLALRRERGSGDLRDLLRGIVASGVGFLVPVAGALVWLAWHGALAPFLSMAIHYLPLHTAMTGSHQTLPGDQRALYLLESTLRFGGYGPLLLASLVGIWHVLGGAGRDRGVGLSALCLLGCLLAYAVYPALAGKFWPYHYMPLAFFASVSAGLCLARSSPSEGARDPSGRARRGLPIAILVLAVVLQLNLLPYAVRTLSVPDPDRVFHVPKGGRADGIARWLKARLEPGDTVQPLDWTGGAVHGMLIARAELATRFLYDYHFYHHVSSPFVQELREEFLHQLRAAAPRFVVEVHADRPWPSGIGASRRFEELRRLLETGYARAGGGPGYRIYERLAEDRSAGAASRAEGARQP